MTEKAIAFLKARGIDPNTTSDVKHYGVKGMSWGKRRTDTDGDGLVDSLAENFNSGGDVDDLELESGGAILDALLDGTDPDTNLSAQRIFTPDGDDKFWENAGRNLENFFGGKKAQKARNVKLSTIISKPFEGAASFVSDLFGKKK